MSQEPPVWSYEVAPDLDQDLVERLRSFPRQPDMSVYGLRLVFSLLLRGYLRVYHRYTASGLEHLPGEESYVVVANHASHLDTLCLLAAMPLRRLHQTFPAAAADYFFEKAPQTLVAGALINAMPFDRLRHKAQSLTMCRQLLDQPGNILILFPEGTRSASGELLAFRPGIGYLTAGTEIPVVPCFLEGAARALPKRAWLPRPTRLRARFGRTRRFSQHEPGRSSGLAIAQILQQDVEALRDGG